MQCTAIGNINNNNVAKLPFTFIVNFSKQFKEEYHFFKFIIILRYVVS